MVAYKLSLRDVPHCSPKCRQTFPHLTCHTPKLYRNKKRFWKQYTSITARRMLITLLQQLHCCTNSTKCLRPTALIYTRPNYTEFRAECGSVWPQLSIYLLPPLATRLPRWDSHRFLRAESKLSSTYIPPQLETMYHCLRCCAYSLYYNSQASARTSLQKHEVKL